MYRKWRAKGGDSWGYPARGWTLTRVPGYMGERFAGMCSTWNIGAESQKCSTWNISLLRYCSYTSICAKNRKRLRFLVVMVEKDERPGAKRSRAWTTPLASRKRTRTWHGAPALKALNIWAEKGSRRALFHEECEKVRVPGCCTWREDGRTQNLRFPVSQAMVTVRALFL